MMRWIEFFAANRVAANLLMWGMILAGLASIPLLRQEPYPSPSFDIISITTRYPGAAPDEVEKAVCVRIEEAIYGVAGVQRITSSASEGFGSVSARLETNAEPRRVLEEIQNRIDAIDTLPKDADRPLVQELFDNSVLLGVVIHGETDEWTLRRIGERVRDEIAALEDVSRAELVGVRDYEVSLEISELDLRRHGLSFDDVARAVRGSSLDLPSGALKTEGGEILLRAQAQAYYARDFEDIVLLTRADGTRLHLREVAHVFDGFAESDEHIRFDGQPAALVRLLTRESKKSLQISRSVHAYVAETRTRMPRGVELSLWNDESQALESRRSLLLENAALGGVLVLAILALFLRVRLAYWVSLGIPVSFLGALSAMGFLDVSINMMSLFAFIVALGLVVDDAIVVGESIATHQGKLGDPFRGAVLGTRAVAKPVLIAMGTNLLFFLPALWLPKEIGKLVYSLAVVVIACLVVSLVECFLVLPAHLAHRARPHGSSPSWMSSKRISEIQRRFAMGLERWSRVHYRRGLEATLRHPSLVLSIASAMLMLSVASVWGGWLPFGFFPEVEADIVSARIDFPEGTSLEVTEAAVHRLESAAIVVHDELRATTGADAFEHILLAIGDLPDKHDDFKQGGDGPHVGHVRIQLAPSERRPISSLEVEERWRRATGGIPGALSLRFTGSDILDEPPIDVELASADAAQLDGAIESLKRELAALPGVREISDSLHGGKQELKLRIQPAGEALGLTIAELARQVRQGFHGEEIQRVQRGRDDVAVMLRYPESERRSLSDLSQIRIRNPAGGELPFSVVARAELGRGYSLIERSDRRRKANVKADVDSSIASSSQIWSELESRILPSLMRTYPAVRVDRDGLKREELELLQALARDWVLALFAAYALLAACLRSYLQPLLILAAIPFGFVGAVAAHLALGLELSAFSLVGLVALSGVVINDSLVLLDGINSLRSKGVPPLDALLEAAADRFRPILLTSLTTFFGLLPLLFERSTQADWLKPVAATLGFGILIATGIVLFVVPALYRTLEHASVAFKYYGRPAPAPRERAEYPCTP